MNRSLLRDEEEKAKIQRDLTKMTERLARLNEDLARKMQVRRCGRGAARASAGARSGSVRLTKRTPSTPQARLEFDQTIQETEAAYMKILESSSTLLGVLKRESTNLKKTATSSRP